MRGLLLSIFIFITIVIILCSNFLEKFYLEPAIVRPSYDPEVALKSGMLYNPEALYD